MFVPALVGMPASAIAGVLLAVLWVAYRMRNRVPTRLLSTDGRIRRLSNEVSGWGIIALEDGQRLADEDVAFLIDCLDHDSPFTRYSAAEVLLSATIRRREQLRGYESTLLARAADATATDVRRYLLRTLYWIADDIEDSERLARVTTDALYAREIAIVEEAPRLLVDLADEEPDILRQHTDEMRARLDDVSPDERAQLVFTLAVLATESADGDHEKRGRTPGDAPPRREEIPATVTERVPAQHRDTVALLFDRLDDEPVVRAKAIAGLGLVGQTYPETAVSIVSVLSDWLDDADDDTRAAATAALLEVSKATPAAVVPVVDAVAARLADEADTRRYATQLMWTLADTEAEALESAVEPLTERLDDEDESVRIYATATLAEIVDDGPSPERATTERAALAPEALALVLPVRDLLFDRLSDDNEAKRRAAARTLSVLAEHAPVLVSCRVDRLLDALDGDDEQLRAHVATALATASLGPHRIRE